MLGAFTFFTVSARAFATYLKATGQVKLLFYRSIFYAGLKLVGVVIAAQFSLMAVAWTVGATLVINWLLLMGCSLRSLNIKGSHLLKLLLHPALISFVLLVTLLSAKAISQSLGFDSAWQLIIAQMIGSGLFGVVLMVVPEKIIGTDAHWLRSSIMGGIMNKVRKRNRMPNLENLKFNKDGLIPAIRNSMIQKRF